MTRRFRGSSVDSRARVAVVATAIIAVLAGCGTSTSGTAVRGGDVVTGIQARPTSGITTPSNSSRPAPSAPAAPAAPTSAPAAQTTAVNGADKFADMVRLVVAAHASLKTVTKTTHNRDPYSVDNYTSVQQAFGGRVLQQVTFEPTTSAIFGIEEIRCLGTLNFITPIPFDIEVQTDDAHPWVSADAVPSEDAPDSEHLTSYFCDGGYPSGLGYDVEFLLSAADVAVVGTVEDQGEQLQHLVVDILVADAYQVPGLGWVGGADVPDDNASTVQVELFIGADDLVRRLTSKVQVGGRELGVEIEFSGFNQDVTLVAPDPAQVAQR